MRRIGVRAAKGAIVEGTTGHPKSKSELIVEALLLRDACGRSMFEVIRNGHWDPAYFQRVCAALETPARLKREPLSDDAQMRVLHILITAFAAKDKWPFREGSDEYLGLARLVSALYEAVMGNGQEAVPLHGSTE
jgi:hypothetical protein